MNDSLHENVGCAAMILAAGLAVAAIIAAFRF